MTLFEELIYSGFVSKVVSNCFDISWMRIKKAITNRKTEHQNLESQIYSIIVETLNKITNYRYIKDMDSIYNAAECILKSFKSNERNDLENIKFCLHMFDLKISINDSLTFKSLIYEELSKSEYSELYRSILLLQLQQKNQYDCEVYEQLNQKLDEVILALNRKRNIGGIVDLTKEIKSRTKEYAKKWNENMFLNNFDKRNDHAGKNVKLREVYLEEHLPHYIWKDNNEEEPLKDLKELIAEYVVENEGRRMLLVLGQPGIGKSTLITWIIANLMIDIDRVLVYKFASDLKRITLHIRKSGSDITTILLEELNLAYKDLEGKIIILDGFDELGVGNKRSKILRQLYWTLIKEGLLKKFTLIITCRENYIQGLNVIGCDYIKLLPWDHKQIQSFYEVYQKKTNCYLSENTLNNIKKHWSILGIPLILYMVLALEISVDNDNSIAGVYNQIFSLEGGIYDRCIKECRYEREHRISDIKDQIHKISRKIAIWIFEHNPNEAYIPKSDYLKICDQVAEGQSFEIEIKSDFLIGNYFKLVKYCEGIGFDELYFIHRSIYEYFVAEYIFTSIHSEIDLSIEDLAGILGNLLKGNRLSKEICGFLEYKFRNESSFDIAIMVNQAFQLMLQDGMTYYTRMYFKNVIVCELNVFYNMLDIMHLWEKNRLKFDSSIGKYLSCNKNFIANLSYTDLSDINLVNADLSKADLTGVNLNRSDLRNANLLGTKLYEASLVNAKLNGCNLTEARLMGANLEETEFDDASLKGTVFSEIQINYLEEKYDIRRERAITKETLKLMEDLDSKNNGRKNDILSLSEIDALLEALSSGELDVDEEDMDKKM